MRFIFFISLLLFLNACTEQSNDKIENPKPTGTWISDLDDPLKDSLKQVYFDQLYHATAGTDVDAIRRANRERNYRIKQQRKQSAMLRSGTELFANNAIEANWHERGPDNEAGDMRIVDYVPSSNRLYGLSSRKHLWRGTLNGNDWVLLNDDIEFDRTILNALPNGSGHRIFAIYGSGVDDKTIRYSDDDGSTWTRGTGFSFYDHWGAPIAAYTLSDDNTIYYLVHTWSGVPFGQLIQLYSSTDKGETYTKVWDTDVTYTGNDVRLWKPHDSDQMFLIDNKGKEFMEVSHDFGSGATTVSAAVSFADQNIEDGDLLLSGRYNTTLSTYELFIHHRETDKVYKTSDGANWTYLSTPISVWQKGWLADPGNSNLYAGGFQVNVSADNTNWEELYDYWWKYYVDSKDSLHVDIMNMQAFEMTNGTDFIIVCNHSGIHVTYDHFHSSQNLAWNTLNVTTLYDQTTTSDGFVYAGAQDKGTFVYTGDSQTNFNQFSTNNMSTGDGMLGVFFNNEQSFYGMIQNGQFAVFPDRDVNSKTWYTIPGDNKPGWINPMVATPDPADNKAYMAGGNLNGGTGSYLIEMDVDISGGVTFNPTQYNYDFRANSNSGSSVIKAIGVAQSDEDRIYVATQDATFFYSENQGTSWTKSTASLPSSMVPWEIISSKTNADKVFISGSGFSNTGVYQSDDGGDTFTALSNNIPSATFYEVALSDAEDMLFASTSEGPYVYVFAFGQWYDLIGATTPVNADFNSVDNIGNDVIRFGTYGRGIMDFEIVSTALPVELMSFDADLKKDETVLIKWISATELNVSHYEVQHSTDGIRFDEIGKVVAEGNSSLALNYEFKHNNPTVGDNYYRLKMYDLDGSFEYSQVRVINVGKGAVDFVLYPNPLIRGNSLNIKTGFEQEYSLEIFDGQGRLVFSKVETLGNTNLNLNIPTGSYFYRIIGGKNMKTGSLIIQ